MFYFSTLLMCISLIYIKGSQDILQGVSKLDNLLLVSVFQRYKDPSLRNRKFTVGSVHSFERLSSTASQDYILDTCTFDIDNERPYNSEVVNKLRSLSTRK